MPESGYNIAVLFYNQLVSQDGNAQIRWALYNIRPNFTSWITVKGELKPVNK